MARKLQTVAQFTDDNPFSEPQVRWWIFNEAQNGMAAHAVTVRIGRRVFIDPAAFERWVDAQQQDRTVAA